MGLLPPFLLNKRVFHSLSSTHKSRSPLFPFTSLIYPIPANSAPLFGFVFSPWSCQAASRPFSLQTSSGAQFGSTGISQTFSPSFLERIPEMRLGLLTRVLPIYRAQFGPLPPFVWFSCFRTFAYALKSVVVPRLHGYCSVFFSIKLVASLHRIFSVFRFVFRLNDPSSVWT